jgi:hypothetical protein
MRRFLPVLLAAVAGCAGSRTRSCAPAFDYQSRWYGADAAYSVPLADGRSLWFFGDTFYGEPGKKDRSGTRLKSGTAFGISDCDGGTFSIRYHFDGDKMPIRPSGGLGYYWPLDAFYHGGRVYLGLVEVGRADPKKPHSLENLGLKGALLATIPDPYAAPSSWKIRYNRLASTGTAIPGGGIAVSDGHAYLLTYFTDRPGKSPVGVTRIPLEALESDPGGALEYLAADGSWRPGLPPSRNEAKLVFDDDATEISVKRLRNGKWAAVYNYAYGFGKGNDSDPTPGVRVWIRTAGHPAGPWSPRRILHTIDAKALTDGKNDNSVFCYAAKLHPQYARGREMPMTTVCNSMDLFGSMIRHRRLYTPQVDWVTLP